MNRFTNILIAEDDGEDYKFLADVLLKIASPDNISITRAKNGLECMSLVKKNATFDIIFIDLNMPGYNGIDCLKFVKSNPLFVDVPVIIYSTSHYIKDIDACFKNDAHYYIVKPTSEHVLFEMLSAIIVNCSIGNLLKPDKEKFVVRISETIRS